MIHSQMRIRNNEAIDKATAYINSVGNIEELIKEKGLLGNNYKRQGDALWISCPWMDDIDPSLSIDVPTGRWKCFASGKGGRYLNMLFYITTLVERKKINYYDFLESLVRTDNALRSHIGFRSIYFREDTKYSLDDLIKEGFNKSLKLQDDTVDSPLELVNRLILKDKLDKNTILRCCILLQSDFNTNDIWNIITGKGLTEVESTPSVINISSFFEE